LEKGLDGELKPESSDDLIQEILKVTLGYRKRQYTWFRKEKCWRRVVVSGMDVEEAVDTILKDEREPEREG
jgi:tRNA A37 N6-isopentenylltransferase MiaA